MADRTDEYDAVIVGASFGGLAAAGQLQGAGSVLLVDREPVGTGETSACGTLPAVLERLDALDAVEQVHPEVAINAAGRRIRFRPDYPLATFDYATLCQILAGRLVGVETAVGTFHGVGADGAVIIGERRVQARLLVDASGWRAVLARQFGAAPPDPAHRSVGAELRHGHGGCHLEFWVRLPERPDGMFWAFPAGDHVREGVASYLGRGSGLRSDLAGFVAGEELPARTVHGGVFPSRLRDPVAGPVFVVGDAAGQCLPLTGGGDPTGAGVGSGSRPPGGPGTARRAGPRPGTGRIPEKGVGAEPAVRDAGMASGRASASTGEAVADGGETIRLRAAGPGRTALLPGGGGSRSTRCRTWCHQRHSGRSNTVRGRTRSHDSGGCGRSRTPHASVRPDVGHPRSPRRDT